MHCVRSQSLTLVLVIVITHTILGASSLFFLGVKFLQPKTLITLSPKFDAHL
jgi:hypothetical protein